MPWHRRFFTRLSLMSAFINLTSKRFGKLTVAWPAGRGNRGEICWLCFCDCGGHSVVRGVLLRTGKVDRCPHEARVRARTKHGHSADANPSPEYMSWSGMIQRCTNRKTNRWRHYGGRGIKVCKRWLKFENFLADMGPKPKPKRRFSIDRIDNNGNYETSNCRWATYEEQNRHRKRDKRGRFQWSKDAV